MTEQRPQDWEWVKATHQCKAIAMFGRLQALAQRDIDQRNEQLGRKTFHLTEINGLEFSISKNGGWDDRVFFKVSDDALSRVSTCGPNAVNEVVYTVGLDADGLCRFRRGDEHIDPWQVLHAALAPLLFG